MSVVLIILKIYILAACWSCVFCGETVSDNTQHQEAYVRLIYPTHSDINLELYHQTRVHPNGGPVLPKPIAFRQPSFVITSFQADLHRPASNETHASARPAYVIKPFKAQLLEHELGFTADGRVAPRNSQVPSPDPVELAVAKGETLREKVTMPLVLEANSRRRHFSPIHQKINNNQFKNSSAESSTFSSLLYSTGLNEKSKGEAPSNSFSLPPYPLTRVVNNTSTNQVERQKSSSTNSRQSGQRPAKTHVIKSLLKQLLEVARDIHSSEAIDDSSIDAEAASKEAKSHDVTGSEEEPIKDEQLLNYQQPSSLQPVEPTLDESSTHLTPLSSFVLESGGSRDPITSIHSTGVPTSDALNNTATLQRSPEGLLDLFSSNHELTLNLEEQKAMQVESETTTLVSHVETTTAHISEPEFNQTDGDRELMEDVAVYHSDGPVSISSTYTGSRIFSMDSSKIDSQISETTEGSVDVTSAPLPFRIESENLTSVIAGSIKTEHLANTTYRENVVKMASLYIAELIANIMALGQHAKGSETGKQVTGMPVVEENEATRRPEPLEERETSRPAETQPETFGAVREIAVPSLYTPGKPLFVVEAKTSYVFPTDTPVPASSEKAHRQEYHTLVESEEDEDAVESTHILYRTPHELMRSVRNRRSWL